MPSDLLNIADPVFILLAWASGLALVSGLVSATGKVGVGFTWLTAGGSAAIGMAGSLSTGAWWARAALAGVVISLALARRNRLAGQLLVVAGLLYLVEAGRMGGLLPAASASVALGGVTGEMALGHWYLVDPRLPRQLLRSLAIAGIAGLVGDGFVIQAVGQLPGGPPDVAFWVLLVTSVALMVGVMGALRQPSYSGVMAATGLSYLAVLTTLGAVFLGRALHAGLGPFAT